MNGYIAFFNGRQEEIYAESLYAANVRAIELFKPAKSKKHMVHVELAEIEGEQVTTFID